MINVILYQVLDQIWNGLTNNQQLPEGVTLVTNIVPYIMIAVFAFFGYWFYSIRKNVNTPPNDEEYLGEIQFHFMGRHWIKGHVSRWTLPLSNAIINELKQSPNFVTGITELQELIKSKKIYLFEIKSTDFEDVADIRGKKINGLVISSGDIGNARYAWQDSKSSWSLWRGFNRLKHVWCYENSEYQDVKTIEGQIKDVWIISPVPRASVGDEGTIGIQNEKIKTKAYSFVIDNLPDKKALAESIPHLVAVATSSHLIMTKNVTIKQYEALLQNKNAEIFDLKREVDTSNLIIAEKPIIQVEDPRAHILPSTPWFWFVMFGVSALVGTHLNNIDGLRGLNPDLGGVLCIVFMIGFHWVTHRSRQRV